MGILNFIIEIGQSLDYLLKIDLFLTASNYLHNYFNLHVCWFLHLVFGIYPDNCTTGPDITLPLQLDYVIKVFFYNIWRSVGLAYMI